MRYASIRDLSRNPAKVIEGEEPVIITKNGKPMRILIPFNEDMLLLNEPIVKQSIRESRKARQKGNRGKTVKQLLSKLDK